MRNHEPLPDIFSKYLPSITCVEQASATTWTSSCPACGGTPHRNGEPSDRVTWFMEGKPLGWCRRCNQIFWPDGPKPTFEEVENWRRKQIEYEQARKRSAELALTHLQSSRIWETYHDEMTEEGFQWWTKRGIPHSMVDWWTLGWNPSRMFWSQGHEVERATATIPIFDHQRNVLNIKNRVVDPPADVSRYRYELGHSTGLLFLTDPDLPLEGHVIAVEGEIKAMVAWFRLGKADQVLVGLPGVTPGQEVVDKLKGAERVTLVVDPGAKAAGVALGKKLGVRRTWLLETPEKIDDAILEQGMKATDVARMLNGAAHLANYVKETS